jgi:hypothetical protein
LGFGLLNVSYFVGNFFAFITKRLLGRRLFESS